MLKFRLNLIMLVFLAVLIFLQYQLWFETGGIYDMWQLKKKIQLTQLENLKLSERNKTLLFQIERLQNSQDATESRARNELGMVKKGETFYQIVK